MIMCKNSFLKQFIAKKCGFYFRFPFRNDHSSEFVTHFTVIHIKKTIIKWFLVGKRRGQFFSIFFALSVYFRLPLAYFWKWSFLRIFYLYTDIKQLSKGYLPSRKLYSGGGASHNTLSTGLKNSMRHSGMWNVRGSQTLSSYRVRWRCAVHRTPA